MFFYLVGVHGNKVNSATSIHLSITHIGEPLQLPALVIADHPIQQHPLRAVQLLGCHGHLDVIMQHRDT